MPGAARQGDPGLIHCSPWTIAGGSSDVFINGRPAARIGDSTSLHLKPDADTYCFPHAPKITQGAATVFINGRPAARRGSAVAGCTRVVGGSSDVEIGGASVGGGSGFLFQALVFAASAVELGPVLDDVGAPIEVAGDVTVIDI